MKTRVDYFVNRLILAISYPSINLIKALFAPCLEVKSVPRIDFFVKPLGTYDSSL